MLHGVQRPAASSHTGQVELFQPGIIPPLALGPLVLVPGFHVIRKNGRCEPGVTQDQQAAAETHVWMRAHLSADQRQAHSRAAVAVNPLASSLHGPPSHPAIASVRSMVKRAAERTNERTPACWVAGFGDGVLEALGHRWLFLASAGRGGRAISHLLRHPSNLCFPLPSPRPTNPQPAGLHRNGARSSKATREPCADEGADEGGRAIVRTVVSCGLSGHMFTDKEVLVVVPGHIGTVSTLTERTKTRSPATQAPRHPGTREQAAAPLTC